MWNWLSAPPPPVPAEVLTSVETETESKTETETETETVTESIENKTKDITLQDLPSVKNVKEVASQWGSYLYGFANVAANTANKLKDTATSKLDNTILGDFSRENEKFKQEKEARRIGDGTPPWVGYHEEAAMKRQILALSTDERNFLRSPPSGVEFVFDIEHYMPVAMATLAEDENLAKMRFALVPKRIKEELFWRNFFYRVSLVKQSTQLSSMADQEMKPSPYTSSTESLNKSAESPVEPPSDDVASPEETNAPLLIDISPDVEDVSAEVVETHEDVTEFVSDAFQEGDLSEEERNQMIAMTNEDPVPEKSDDVTDDITDDVTDDWDLDKELQDEIDSFELVNENDNGEEWEKEIEDLIELDASEKTEAIKELDL